MTDLPRLSAMEAAVLAAWSNTEIGYGFGFGTASRLSGVPRQNIRRAVRSLARKGALEYVRSLYWEDEPKMGAGYILTETGAAVIAKLEESPNADEQHTSVADAMLAAREEN